jgi:nitrite reductase/ring-hydroxylating ferredoxin subunit
VTAWKIAIKKEELVSENSRSSPDEQQSGISRREALRAASGAACAALAGCGVPGALGSGLCMGPLSPSMLLASNAEELPLNSAVRVMGASRPIYVARDEQGFMALDATCTHQSCEADYVQASNLYERGCHGSRFRLDGSVAMGPAQRPLAHVYICRNSAGLLVVEPDRVLPGNSDRIQ